MRKTLSPNLHSQSNYSNEVETRKQL